MSISYAKLNEDIDFGVKEVEIIGESKEYDLGKSIKKFFVDTRCVIEDKDGNRWIYSPNTDRYYLYFDKKYNCLINDFESYLKNNKSIILNGFLNFRIKDYMSILEEVVDEAVNNFVIEKEYLEFISLLKMYVNSQKSTCDIVHLIYNNESSILLDKDKNIINVSDDVFKAKYLSDISFSSNDYALNSLLTLIPKKIYIHLIDNCIDEFIHTLSLIFESRVEICTDCDIFKIYKNNPMNLKRTFIKK